jgi:hypothetical protein
VDATERGWGMGQIELYKGVEPGLSQLHKCLNHSKVESKDVS